MTARINLPVPCIWLLGFSPAALASEATHLFVASAESGLLASPQDLLPLLLAVPVAIALLRQRRSATPVPAAPLR